MTAERRVQAQRPSEMSGKDRVVMQRDSREEAEEMLCLVSLRMIKLAGRMVGLIRVAQKWDYNLEWKVCVYEGGWGDKLRC